MTVPTCNVHGKPMRAGKRPGEFFCTSFVGVGQPGANDKGYCTQRTAAPTPAAPIPYQGPGRLATQPNNGTDSRYAACLTFAGLVFRGVGPEMSEDAKLFADKVFAGWPS